MRILANANFFPEPKVTLGKNPLYVFFEKFIKKAVYNPLESTNKYPEKQSSSFVHELNFAFD